MPPPRVEGRSTSTLGKDIKRDSNSVGVAISRRRYPQQAIAFSRSSYLAGVNVAIAYRMVISLLPLGEGWNGATFVSCLRLHLIIYIGHTAPKEETQ